jgi:hypothetical protein
MVKKLSLTDFALFSRQIINSEQETTIKNFEQQLNKIDPFETVRYRSVAKCVTVLRVTGGYWEVLNF